jgi:hypothetical protein
MTWMQLDHDHLDRPESFDVAEKNPLALLLEIRMRLWASKQTTGGSFRLSAIKTLAMSIGLTMEQAIECTAILTEMRMWEQTSDTEWRLVDHETVSQLDEARTEARELRAERNRRHRAPAKRIPGQRQLPGVGITSADDLAQPSVLAAEPQDGVRRLGDALEKRREEKRREDTYTGTVSPLEELTKALLEAEHGTGIHEITRSATKAAASAAKELLAIGATPQTIAATAAAHRAKWPTMACTARSIAKHWASMQPTVAPIVDTLDRDRRNLTTWIRNVAPALNWCHEALDSQLNRHPHGYELHNEMHQALDAAYATFSGTDRELVSA